MSWGRGDDATTNSDMASGLSAPAAYLCSLVLLRLDFGCTISIFTEAQMETLPQKTNSSPWPSFRTQESV